MRRPQRPHRAAPVRGGLVAVVLVAVSVVTGCRSDSGSVEAFCNQVTRVPVITDPDQLTMPDPASAAGALVTELRRLRAAAPDDVRAEVTVLVEVSEQLERALTAPDETSRAAAGEAVDERRAAWKDASTTVVAYAKRRCDIDLGAS